MIRAKGKPVPPRSRAAIVAEANFVRNALGLSGGFSMIRLIEFVLPQLIPEFTFDVLSRKDMGGDAARTFPDEYMMWIRDDVYEEAYLLTGETTRLYGQHNFTLAHELGHLVLHQEASSYARQMQGRDHKIFMDSEWQADEFSAAFLMPKDKVQLCAGPEEVERRFWVSCSAAHNRFENVAIKGR